MESRGDKGWVPGLKGRFDGVSDFTSLAPGGGTVGEVWDTVMMCVLVDDFF